MQIQQGWVLLLGTQAIWWIILVGNVQWRHSAYMHPKLLFGWATLIKDIDWIVCYQEAHQHMVSISMTQDASSFMSAGGVKREQITPPNCAQWLFLPCIIVCSCLFIDTHVHVLLHDKSVKWGNGCICLHMNHRNFLDQCQQKRTGPYTGSLDRGTWLHQRHVRIPFTFSNMLNRQQ